MFLSPPRAASCNGPFVLVGCQCGAHVRKVLEGEWIVVFVNPFTQKVVAFDVYCPPQFELRGVVPVQEILDKVAAQEIKNPFGNYIRRIYQLAEGLTVTVPAP
jgi:hypothetical protein